MLNISQNHVFVNPRHLTSVKKPLFWSTQSYLSFSSETQISVVEKRLKIRSLPEEQASFSFHSLCGWRLRTQKNFCVVKLGPWSWGLTSYKFRNFSRVVAGIFPSSAQQGLAISTDWRLETSLLFLHHCLHWLCDNVQE